MGKYGMNTQNEKLNIYMTQLEQLTDGIKYLGDYEGKEKDINFVSKITAKLLKEAYLAYEETLKDSPNKDEAQKEDMKDMLTLLNSNNNGVSKEQNKQVLEDIFLNGKLSGNDEKIEDFTKNIMNLDTLGTLLVSIEEKINNKELDSEKYIGNMLKTMPKYMSISNKLYQTYDLIKNEQLDVDQELRERRELGQATRTILQENNDGEVIGKTETKEDYKIVEGTIINPFNNEVVKENVFTKLQIKENEIKQEQFLFNEGIDKDDFYNERVVYQENNEGEVKAIKIEAKDQTEELENLNIDEEFIDKENNRFSFEEVDELVDKIDPSFKIDEIDKTVEVDEGKISRVDDIREKINKAIDKDYPDYIKKMNVPDLELHHVHTIKDDGSRAKVDYNNVLFDNSRITKCLMNTSTLKSIQNRIEELDELSKTHPEYNTNYKKEKERLSPYLNEFKMVKDTMKEDLNLISTTFIQKSGKEFEKEFDNLAARLLKGEKVFSSQEFYEKKGLLSSDENKIKYLKEMVEYKTNVKVKFTQKSEKQYAEDIKRNMIYQSINYIKNKEKDEINLQNLFDGINVNNASDKFMEVIDKVVDGDVKLNGFSDPLKKTSDTYGKVSEYLFDYLHDKGLTKQYGSIIKKDDLRNGINKRIDGVEASKEMLNKFYKDDLGLKNKDSKLTVEQKATYKEGKLYSDALGTYHRLQEIHNKRGTFFWLRHPVQHYHERTTLNEMKSYLKNNFGGENGIDDKDFETTRINSKGKKVPREHPIVVNDATNKLYLKQEFAEKNQDINSIDLDYIDFDFQERKYQERQTDRSLAFNDKTINSKKVNEKDIQVNEPIRKQALNLKEEVKEKDTIVINKNQNQGKQKENVVEVQQHK